jgi:hypothetical protein
LLSAHDIERIDDLVDPPTRSFVGGIDLVLRLAPSTSSSDSRRRRRPPTRAVDVVVDRA